VLKNVNPEIIIRQAGRKSRTRGNRRGDSPRIWSGGR